MERYHTRARTLDTAVFRELLFAGAKTRADRQAESDAVGKKIDIKLCEQSEADVRAWLEDDRAVEVEDWMDVPLADLE